MASAWGLLRDKREIIEPYNVDELTQIAMYKQQQYDNNVSLINQELQSIAGLDLIKSEDRDYYYSRLNQVANNINAVGGGDYSSAAVANRTVNYLRSAIDENVAYAINSTARVRKDMLDIQTAKEAGDGTYSIANEAYTMEAINNYLMADTTTTKNAQYVSRGYTPFVDVYGKMDKEADAWIKTRGEQSVDVDMGNGLIINKKVKNLNVDELRSFIYGRLTPDDRRQLEVNAWYNYSKSPTTSVQTAFNNYVAQKTSLIDGDIASIELGIDKLTGDSLTQAQQRLEGLKAQKATFTSQAESITDPYYMGVMLETEGLVEALASKYSRNPVSYSIDKNEVYFAQQKLMLDYQELALSERRTAATELRARASALQAGTRVNGQTSGSSSFPQISSAVTDIPSSLEIKKQVHAAIDVPRKEAAVLGKDIVSSFANDTAMQNVRTASGFTIMEAYQGNIQAVRSEAVGKGMLLTEEEASMRAMDMLLENENTLVFSNASPELAKNMRDYKYLREQYQTRIEWLNTERQSAINQDTLDPARMLDFLTNGWDTLGNEASSRVLLDVDGRQIRLNDLLNQNNLRNPQQFAEYLEQNPDIKSQIATRIYSYATIKKFAEILGAPEPEINDVGKIVGYNFDATNSDLLSQAEAETLLPLAKLSKASGREINSYSFANRNKGTLSISIYSPIFGEAIQDFMAVEGIGRSIAPLASAGFSLGDRLFNNRAGQNFDNAVDKLVFGEGVFSSKKEEDVYKRAFGMLAENRQILLTPDSQPAEFEAAYAQLNLIGVDAETGDIAPVDSKEPIAILRSEDPNVVILRQRDVTRNSKGEITGGYVQARVPIQDIQSTIGRTINLSAAEANGTFNSLPVPVKPVSGYLNPYEDVEAVSYLRSNGLDTSRIDMATAGGASTAIKNADIQGWLSTDLDKALRNGQITQETFQAINYFKKGINDIVTNPTGISVGTKKSGDVTYVVAKVGEEVFNIPTSLTGESVRSLESDLRYNRNIGLTAFLSNVLLQAQQANARGSSPQSSNSLQTLNNFIAAYYKQLARKD